MSQDDFYHTHRARLDTIIGDNAGFYSALKQARDLWVTDHPDQPMENFLAYLESMYGIHMSARQKRGGLDPDYQITDQQKYLMFVLRFGV